MGWWMLWGWLMVVLIWGAIIALAVWAVQAVTRRESAHTEPQQTSPPARLPLDIAKERHARGDIARDEFEQIKVDLEDS